MEDFTERILQPEVSSRDLEKMLSLLIDDNCYQRSEISDVTHPTISSHGKTLSRCATLLSYDNFDDYLHMNGGLEYKISNICTVIQQKIDSCQTEIFFKQYALRVEECDEYYYIGFYC